MAPIISVEDLSIDFTTDKGQVPGLRDVSFELHPGEKLSIVGESGSGKSTTAKTLNYLLPENAQVTSGQVLYEGESILDMKPERLRQLRGGGIGLVPQDPMSNLNPIQAVGRQVAEALAVQKYPRAKIKSRVIELFEMVGIPNAAKRVKQYPHELSGGLRQRVLLAMGLACAPRVLIADEPTSALDVTVQRTILDKLDDLIEETGTSLILITHDLELAAERTDRVLVMRQGSLVEQGPAREILRNPKEKYTRLLVDASPTLNDSVLVQPVPRQDAEVMIEVRNLRREYGKAKNRFTAVEDSSFNLVAGETVAIVGESGSGKSTTANLILGLDTPTSGSISILGEDLATMRKNDLFGFRRRVQPVFQSPYGSLDPYFTIAESIAEPLVIHRVGEKAEQSRRVDELLFQVDLPSDVANRYPRELSGGQLQRVAIARALALEPKILVLDEPVSALDVVVQKQILDLLVDLQQKLGLSYIFISHDLAVVKLISHYVHVMESGKIVESGPVEEVFSAPRSEYTKKLLGAVPKARV